MYILNLYSATKVKRKYCILYIIYYEDYFICHISKYNNVYK